MYTVDIIFFVSASIYAGVAFITVLWVYYDTYGKTIHEDRRNRAVFHCVRCGHVYTAPKEHEEALCTRCGMDNIKLRF